MSIIHNRKIRHDLSRLVLCLKTYFKFATMIKIIVFINRNKNEYLPVMTEEATDFTRFHRSFVEWVEVWRQLFDLLHFRNVLQFPSVHRFPVFEVDSWKIEIFRFIFLIIYLEVRKSSTFVPIFLVCVSDLSGRFWKKRYELKSWSFCPSFQHTEPCYR